MTKTSTLALFIFFTLLLSVGTGRNAYAEQLYSPSPALGTAPLETQPSAPLGSALEQRMRHEKESRHSRFAILPHRTNYLLPIAYNSSPNSAVYTGISGVDEQLDNLEVKYQISIKTPIWDNIIGNNGTLYVAYSQLAFWQAYDNGASSPFREINFEPEAFVAFNTGYELQGLTSHAVSVGINHQSNGRGKPLSRSWNRITANFVLSSGDTYIMLKPWFRLHESSQEDDNPNMEKYYGYGELLLLQKFKEHTLGLTLRNNLRTSANKGAIQLDWSFPLHNKLKGYVQYFNGYGESLIDYNHSNNRIGVGVMLTDWL